MTYVMTAYGLTFMGIFLLFIRLFMRYKTVKHQCGPLRDA